MPYAASIRVPVWAHGPGVTSTDAGRLVSAVDIPATVYDETGVSSSRTLDGHGLLRAYRRSVAYVEYFNDPAKGAPIPSWATICSSHWRCIQTYQATAGGSGTLEEYCNLDTDPWMMNGPAQGREPGQRPERPRSGSNSRRPAHAAGRDARELDPA